MIQRIAGDGSRVSHSGTSKEEVRHKLEFGFLDGSDWQIQGVLTKLPKDSPLAAVPSQEEHRHFCFSGPGQWKNWKRAPTRRQVQNNGTRFNLDLEGRGLNLGAGAPRPVGGLPWQNSTLWSICMRVSQRKGLFRWLVSFLAST